MTRKAGIMVIMISLLCLVYGAYGEIPHLINYQGQLTDAEGKPIDGAQTVVFRIYDVETGGAPLWQEEHIGVLVENGLVNILLGSKTNLNLSFDKPYFLEMVVNGEVMSPRQRIVSVGYAIRAETAERTERIEGIKAGGDLMGTYPNPAIGSGVITQTKLKTTVGEISWSPPDGHGSMSNMVLPGGTYGFYPQVKMSNTYSSEYWAVKIMNDVGENVWTSYRTNVTLRAPWGQTIYVQQRYVTASGTDYWLFLLVDKETKDIISGYSAADHPSYGNGGDFEMLPHPFTNYDKAKNEVILVDNDTIAELKQAKQERGKEILELVMGEYKVNFDREEKYQPLHSGKYITEDGNPVKEMVERIPSYIKVRKLIKLSEQEKQEREIKREQMREKIERLKIEKRERLKEKFGLSDSELDELINYTQDNQ